MFTKGQILECVMTTGAPELTKGALYTVYWSGLGMTPTGKMIVGVNVVEAAPPHGCDGYGAFRFRPLQDSRLDVFRAMLVQTPAPVFDPSIFVHNGDDGA